MYLKHCNIILDLYFYIAIVALSLEPLVFYIFLHMWLKLLLLMPIKSKHLIAKAMFPQFSNAEKKLFTWRYSVQRQSAVNIEKPILLVSTVKYTEFECVFFQLKAKKWFHELNYSKIVEYVTEISIDTCYGKQKTFFYLSLILNFQKIFSFKINSAVISHFRSKLL